MGKLTRSIGPFAVAAAIALLGACGGDDGDSSSTTGSSDSNPADATIQAAGLEVCSEGEEQLVQSTVGPGLIAVRAFDVATDCMGRTTSPNTVSFFQFDGRESLDAGVETIKEKYPQGEVTTYGAIAILATGPQKTENLAAIEQELQG